MAAQRGEHGPAIIASHGGVQTSDEKTWYGLRVRLFKARRQWARRLVVVGVVLFAGDDGYGGATVMGRSRGQAWRWFWM